MHPSGLNERVVTKVVARRGLLHAFELLTPATTCLVMIDISRACVEQDETCRHAVPRINALASALRSAGGSVAWVSTDFVADARSSAIYGEATVRRLEGEAKGSKGEVWPGLAVETCDLKAVKRGASGFVPGQCDLKDQLAARGIEALLMAGTVTNVCDESSAGDTAERGYRMTLVSDACAGHAHGLHEATFAAFYRAFGDVRPAADVIALLGTAEAGR